MRHCQDNGCASQEHVRHRKTARLRGAPLPCDETPILRNKRVVRILLQSESECANSWRPQCSSIRNGQTATSSRKLKMVAYIMTATRSQRKPPKPDNPPEPRPLPGKQPDREKIPPERPAPPIPPKRPTPGRIGDPKPEPIKSSGCERERPPVPDTEKPPTPVKDPRPKSPKVKEPQPPPVRRLRAAHRPRRSESTIGEPTTSVSRSLPHLRIFGG